VALVSGEADERLPAGPRGEQGKQGERGERGLSWRVGWAIVVLFVISALGIAGNLLWTAHEANVNAAAQRQQQAAQRAQSAAFEHKLCATLGRLASRKPPAGSTSDLSRAYLLWQWSQLAELGPDVGCGSTRK
jgi:hypothetical protein